MAPLSANLNLANLQLQEREFASARLLYEKCIRGFERLQGPRPGLRGLDVWYRPARLRIFLDEPRSLCSRLVLHDLLGAVACDPCHITGHSTITGYHCLKTSSPGLGTSTLCWRA